jgi:hypothetical protein
MSILQYINNGKGTDSYWTLRISQVTRLWSCVNSLITIDLPKLSKGRDGGCIMCIVQRKFYDQNLWLYFDLLSLNFSTQFNLAQLYICAKGAKINCALNILVLQYSFWPIHPFVCLFVCLQNL